MSTPKPSKIYTDSSIWIDYFAPNGSADELINVRTWLKALVQRTDITIRVTNVIMLEFVCHLYYAPPFKLTSKGIRKILRTLINSFNVEVIPMEISETCNRMDWLDRQVLCHIGEVSFLPLLHEPNAILATSDKGPLTAFVFVERVNPRKEPPQVVSKYQPYVV